MGNASGAVPLLWRVFRDQAELGPGLPREPAVPRRVPGLVHFAGKATAVIGMRRAGKTTFLQQVRAGQAASGTPERLLPMLTLEDERLAGLEAESLGEFVDDYADHQASAGPAGPVAWFLDEIQVVPGWERLVRRLLDSGSTQVYVSGSSAALLSREVATALRGRAWPVLIFPFGFDEALVHAGEPVPSDPSAMGRTQRARIEASFDRWLASGGFPEAQGLDDSLRGHLLRDYVDVAVFRDVIDRHQVSNVAGLRWLSRHLLANAGSLFSVEKFHRAIRSQGIAMARDTVHQYLAHLEDCFLVRTVWMESRSERQRMVNPRKAYPIDTGLIAVFDRLGEANRGHALEAAVLVELQRRRSEATYVRTREGHEVDFLARAGDGSAELIQVCDDASDAETAARELRALAEAGRMFPSATKRLLTRTRRGLPAQWPADVEVQPAYEWILASSMSSRAPSWWP